MVDLYLQGVIPRRIGEIYGVSAASVGERLKRMGYDRPFRRLRSVAATVDRERLETLYAARRLSHARIAAEFGVSLQVVRRALKLYGIRKRPRLCPENSRFARVGKLRVGDRIKIYYRDEKQIASLHRAATDLGFVIETRVRRGEQSLEVTRVAEDETRRRAKIAGISRAELEELYAARKLTPSEIGRQLGLEAELIRQALAHYQIPVRRGGSCGGGGKYVDLFRKLKAGETGEIHCAVKHPYINLHSIAARLGMRISMRKIAAERYKITRLF